MPIRKLDNNGDYSLVDETTGEFIDYEPKKFDSHSNCNGCRDNQYKNNISSSPQYYDSFEKLPIDIKEAFAKITWNYLYGDLDESAANEEYCMIKDRIFIINSLKERMHPNHFCNFDKEYRMDLWNTIVAELLRLQNNKYPLKKGGSTVIFKPNLLLDYCSTVLTEEAEIDFDSAMAMISSYPEQTNYILQIDDYSALNLDAYEIKRIMALGALGLKELLFFFNFVNDSGKTLEDKYLMFCYISYENGQITFEPTTFMKALALSATIIPGAYGTQRILAQLHHKYDRRLYWFLANKKSEAVWSDYDNTKIIKCSINELENYLHAYLNPINYEELKDCYLEPAKMSMKKIEEMSFRFDFRSSAELFKDEKKAIVTFKIKEYIEK